VTCCAVQSSRLCVVPSVAQVAGHVFRLSSTGDARSGHMPWPLPGQLSFALQSSRHARTEADGVWCREGARLVGGEAGTHGVRERSGICRTSSPSRVVCGGGVTSGEPFLTRLIVSIRCAKFAMVPTTLARSVYTASQQAHCTRCTRSTWTQVYRGGHAHADKLFFIC
jgi:hypothetical protein